MRSAPSATSANPGLTSGITPMPVSNSRGSPALLLLPLLDGACRLSYTHSPLLPPAEPAAAIASRARKWIFTRLSSSGQSTGKSPCPFSTIRFTTCRGRKTREYAISGECERLGMSMLILMAVDGEGHCCRRYQ